MTVLVGYSPQESGAAALELGVVLARSLDEPLVVTTVVASPYVETRAPVDGDYLGLLRLWAERSLGTAKAAVPSDVHASFEVTEASSISSGLADAAARHQVSMVVLGSSAKGLTGRITLGSVIDALTHGSRWPLALAPRGYRAADDERIDRITVLFSHAAAIDRLLTPARDLAQRLEVSVRFASFLVRPLRREAGLIEPSADDLVVNAWASRTRSDLSALVRERVGGEDSEERFVVGDGLTWAEAASDVPWREGDLAVIGPASSAPLSRVFLGLRASKILRSLPVPVLLVPRGRD